MGALICLFSPPFQDRKYHSSLSSPVHQPHCTTLAEAIDPFPFSPQPGTSFSFLLYSVSSCLSPFGHLSLIHPLVSSLYSPHRHPSTLLSLSLSIPLSFLSFVLSSCLVDHIKSTLFSPSFFQSFSSPKRVRPPPSFIGTRGTVHWTSLHYPVLSDLFLRSFGAFFSGGKPIILGSFGAACFLGRHPDAVLSFFSYSPSISTIQHTRALPTLVTLQPKLNPSSTRPGFTCSPPPTLTTPALLFYRRHRPLPHTHTHTSRHVVRHRLPLSDATTCPAGLPCRHGIHRRRR